MISPMMITLTILALASVLFISGKVRSDLVAIGALILLILFGILSPGEALSGFSNTVVIMMLGLFVVGGGIFQTGLAHIVSRKLLKLAGQNETKLLITIMIVTSIIGAFVSNTGTVAVMLPVVVSLAMSARIHPGRLLMPLAFASSMGGMLTLIGTPPNLIIHESLLEAGYEGLTFFSFTPVGLVCLVTGMISLLVLRRFLPQHNEHDDLQDNGRSLQTLAQQYQLTQNLYRIQVVAGSSICSMALNALDLTSKYGINVIEVRRKCSAKNQFFKTINQEIAGASTVVQSGDILYIHGPFDQVERFAEDYGLMLLDRQVVEAKSASLTNDYATEDVGIAEVLLSPKSRLTNRNISESGFREKFHVNILGIQRKDQLIVHHLKDEKMRFGDAMLVQGEWSNIARLANEPDVVVVGQPIEEQRKVTMDRKAPIAAGIMALMVVLLVTEWIPAVAAVMAAAVLMVIFGCVRTMDDAYKTVNWESIVLIGGMIPMSIAIEKTGAAAMLSNGLVSTLGGYGPMVLLAGIYFATSMLTLFISNTACAVLLAPIAMSSALSVGVSPYPFLFAVAVAASMCFASPFSTPPNALVMSAGRYTFFHYLKVGLPLQLIVGVVMSWTLPLFFSL